jgi:hypothetical protein
MKYLLASSAAMALLASHAALAHALSTDTVVVH